MSEPISLIKKLAACPWQECWAANLELVFDYFHRLDCYDSVPLIPRDPLDCFQHDGIKEVLYNYSGGKTARIWNAFFHL